jgi:hypothetical protein
LSSNNEVEVSELVKKLAREWVHTVKGVPYNTASIVMMNTNFQSQYSDSLSGLSLESQIDVKALEALLRKDGSVSAVFIKPT